MEISSYISCLLAVDETPALVWKPHAVRTWCNLSETQGAPADSLGKNIYAASSRETKSLSSFFLELAFSVSHQNGRLCWGFHHSGFVCVSACVCTAA